MSGFASWPLGWLPVGALLLVWIAARLGSLTLGQQALHLRLVGAGVWGTSFVVVSTWLLALAGLFTRAALLSTWALAALVLGFVGPRPRVPNLRALVALRPRSAWLPVGVAMAALPSVLLVAYWLPIWQWDSLGYHLPYVNFLLQAGGAGGVPKDVPYLSTYPHGAELAFGALRLLLPDDRLIDAGQIPFGCLGAIGIASVARSLGARVTAAVVAGCLWWTLPAVFLQLPTNYVDVAAAAAFLLACAALVAPPTPPVLLTAGAAIGLYLGIKPSAPIGTVLLSAILIARAWPGRQLVWAAAALGLVVLIGGEAYLNNLLRHGNPIWPVKVTLGPLHLPGEESLDKLLSSGAATYKISGPLPWRMLRSWTSLTAPPMFDMRVGGFGPVFWLALPAGLLALVQRRAWLVTGLLVASIAAPDPALARYVLGFPGLLLGLSAALPALARDERRVQVPLHVVLAAIAGWNLVYAWPALTGEGPPLRAYASMTWPERLGAVGGEGRPTALLAARGRLAPGEGAAFDKSMDFPYLLWTTRADNRVVRVPDDATPGQVEALLRRENVKLLGAGPATPLGRYIEQQGSRYLPVHHCKSAECVIYWRRP